jgi:hypothetical protein
MNILDGALMTNVGSDFAAGLGNAAIATNTAFGVNVLGNITSGYENTAIGYRAGRAITSGYRNVAVGAFALQANLSGTHNAAVGVSAIAANVVGNYNAAVGNNALLNNTTGSRNTAVGMEALAANTTGEYNSGLGQKAGDTITTGSNVTCIGYNAQPSAATTTNEIVLGDANIARLRCQVTTITALSDERDKDNIEDLPLGLAFLRDLKPRKFRWHKRIRNEDGTLGERGELGTVDLGFVAQELAAAMSAHDANWTEMVFSMKEGEELETTPGKLLPIMVKAIQELAAENEAMRARIATLENS